MLSHKLLVSWLTQQLNDGERIYWWTSRWTSSIHSYQILSRFNTTAPPKINPSSPKFMHTANSVLMTEFMAKCLGLWNMTFFQELAWKRMKLLPVVKRLMFQQKPKNLVGHEIRVRAWNGKPRVLIYPHWEGFLERWELYITCFPHWHYSHIKC